MGMYPALAVEAASIVAIGFAASSVSLVACWCGSSSGKLSTEILWDVGCRSQRWSKPPPSSVSSCELSTPICHVMLIPEDLPCPSAESLVSQKGTQTAPAYWSGFFFTQRLL